MIIQTLKHKMQESLRLKVPSIIYLISHLKIILVITTKVKGNIIITKYIIIKALKFFLLLLLLLLNPKRGFGCHSVTPTQNYRSSRMICNNANIKKPHYQKNAQYSTKI